METSWQKEPTLRPTFPQIVQLWPGLPTENPLKIPRPRSPASSFSGQIFYSKITWLIPDFTYTASSSRHIFGSDDSQTTLNGIQAWRPRHNSESKSLTAVLPAHRSRSVKGFHSSRPYHSPGGPRSLSASMSSGSTSWRENSSSLSTIPDTDTLAPHTHSSGTMSEVQSIWGDSQRNALHTNGT